jgi:hypothetical protein
MASAPPAPGPDEILGPSTGKTNFTRLTRLLICGGTAITRELFDFMIAPSTLAALLKTPHVYRHLKLMKKRKIFTPPQWKVLFPSKSTCGKSESFDITLIVKLLRELCTLTPPPKGWDALPDDSDLTLPADIARIKYYRNCVYAHGNDRMELTNSDFEDYWKRIKGALLRIVKYYAVSGSSLETENWRKEIKKLRTAPLTNEEAQKNEDKLKTWCLQDPEVKQMLLEMRDEVTKLETRLIGHLEDTRNASPG